MEIRKVRNHKVELCRKILEALPEWFGLERARETYIQAARDQMMLACMVGGDDVGMVTLVPHSPWNLEISVMGVLPSHHRMGVGSALISAADAVALDAEIKLLTVKTLSASSPDHFYKRTRDFYCAIGFELFEEFPDLWDKHNPCALYVRPVGEKK